MNHTTRYLLRLIMLPGFKMYNESPDYYSPIVEANGFKFRGSHLNAEEFLEEAYIYMMFHNKLREELEYLKKEGKIND
jgi:hypothetical protein